VAGVQIDTLEGASKAAQAAAATATEQAQDARTRLTLAQRDVVDAQAAHARAVAAAATRKKALADVEKTSAVASAMEEFRRDRLSRLAPELSEVASDFVARMTEGRYTAVELDEEFTPVLTDASGDQRPVAWLSGGEESAVALALRIAIGEVLAGQRGGLLILDEVLTAQDTSRRQATMAAIRVLPRQVITINHVSEASDMVDLVAEVVDDGEGASTVVAYAPEHAVSNDLSDAMVDA
jgi:exonuclease SbcC